MLNTPDCIENICNNHISTQITSVAKEGYNVKMNLSTVDSSAAVSVSKYWKSRQDLVVCHPGRLGVCIVTHPKPNEREEGRRRC